MIQLSDRYVLAFLASLSSLLLSSQGVMRVDGPVRVQNGYSVNIGNQTLELGPGADVVLSRQLPASRLIVGPTGQITGNSSTRFIDGWVRKAGATPFNFPIGDDTYYGLTRFTPLGSSDISLSYKKESPAALGTTLGTGVTSLSNQQYWLASGSGSAYLTLSWDTGALVGLLTGNDLSKLTIAGWHTTSSQWQQLAAIADVVSLPSGNPSNLLQGSLTTIATVNLGAYSAFTLAAQSNCLIPAPTITAIMQPTCNPSQPGAVSLAGLPPASWMLLISGPEGEEIRSGSGTTYTASNLAPGIYQFSVMDSGGCTSPFTSPFSAILVEY